jgi:hypothetical protein
MPVKFWLVVLVIVVGIVWAITNMIHWRPRPGLSLFKDRLLRTV